MVINTITTVAATRPHTGRRTAPLGIGYRGIDLPISMCSGSTVSAAAGTVTPFDRDRATGFAVKQASPPREVLR